MPLTNDHRATLAVLAATSEAVAASLAERDARVRRDSALAEKRLNYVLENRVVVIDGCVYENCAWTTGRQVIEVMPPITFSLNRVRRAAIDAAMAQGKGVMPSEEGKAEAVPQEGRKELLENQTPR